MKLLGFSLRDLDWGGRAAALARTASGMRPVSVWAGKSPDKCEALLRRKGIRVAEGTVCDDGFVLMVHKDDVNKARRILKREGAKIA